MIPVRYKTVTLSRALIEDIEKIIEEREELGYSSVKAFVEDAVRRRLETLRGKSVGHHVGGHGSREVTGP